MVTQPLPPTCGDENPEENAGEPVDDGWAEPLPDSLPGHPSSDRWIGDDRKDEP